MSKPKPPPARLPLCVKIPASTRRDLEMIAAHLAERVGSRPNLTDALCLAVVEMADRIRIDRKRGEK